MDDERILSVSSGDVKIEYTLCFPLGGTPDETFTSKQKNIVKTFRISLSDAFILLMKWTSEILAISNVFEHGTVGSDDLKEMEFASPQYNRLIQAIEETIELEYFSGYSAHIDILSKQQEMEERYPRLKPDDVPQCRRLRVILNIERALHVYVRMFDNSTIAPDEKLCAQRRKLIGIIKESQFETLPVYYREIQGESIGIA